MLILSEKVTVKWNGANRKKLESYGYVFTKSGQEIEIKIEHLSPSSHTFVSVQCDYCGLIWNKQYSTTHNKKYINKDACDACKYKKTEEVFLLKYGSNSPLTDEEVKEKIKNTNMEKYGVDNYTKTDEYKIKSKETNFKKYGVSNPTKNKDIRNKVKKTNIERYGVEYPLQNSIIRDKWIETNLEKYGVEYPLLSDEVNEKIKDTVFNRYGVEYVTQSQEHKEKVTLSFYKHGTCPTSSQQMAIYEMLKENGYNVELNYPVSNVNLDVAIFIGDFKIDLEYDGSYWHQDSQKDRRRDEFMKSEGWKILRIKSRRKIPSYDEIVNSLNKLISTNRTFTQIVLDDVIEESVYYE